MPRIRTIKPEFASDEKLASVSRDARLTFVLLMTQADDDGLLLARPRQLLGVLYPHDDAVTFADIDGWLTELARIGAIRRRSTSDDAPVLEIANWSRHQRIDHKSKSLILPHLRDVSEETPDILARASRDTRAPTVDLGPTTVDPRPGTDDRSGGVRAALPEAARIAFDGLSAGRPSALAAHLRGLHDGMGGPAYGWDAIGRALLDYHANESKFSARHFRAYCESAARPALARNGSTKHDVTDAAIAEGVRLLNAAGVNGGQ